MSLLHLDTHVVVWLAAGEHRRFSAEVIDRLNGDEVRCSPMVRLELAYLRDIGRITVDPATVVHQLDHALGLRDDATPFPAVVDAARELDFTRDPFDRLILGQAIAAGATLVSKDERIRAAGPVNTIW
ncbi:MAG: PIN domain-containing protein [Protaetiibacter sp.]